MFELAAPQDIAGISQVTFVHDPVPNLPSYLDPKDASFPRTYPTAMNYFEQYCHRLHPRKANFPYRCTLDAVNESRFWKEGLEASRKLLQLLAQDQSTTDITVGRGVTMMKLAERELRPEFEHRFCKATSYMYPFADEERTKLLAASMVMMFLFDDKGEETSESTLKPFTEDFVNRVNNFKEHTLSNSLLQQHIDFVMIGFRNADRAAGNAGREVIGTMSKSFRRMRPKVHFRTIRQYLEFRHDNVGANYVLAAVKFSLCSKVDINDPRLTRYLTLVKDHLAIVNDMASYDKEKRDVDSGAAKDMINIVDVVQQVLSLPDAESAKALTYTYQIQTEARIIEELQRLGREECLEVEHWQYLEATFVCAAGNTFFSMTSSRYGGEAARLPPSINCNNVMSSSLTKKHSLDTGEGSACKLLRTH